MLDNYKDAWLTAPPRVLGRQLLPFSLGHAYLLDVFDSATLVGGLKADVGELAFAVWVCSRPFAECLDGLQDVNQVARQCKKWGRKARKLDYPSEVAVFDAYLHAYYDAAPTRWESGSSTQERVPWQFVLAWTLAGGKHDPAIWDISLSLAFALNASRLTVAGDDSFVSEDELRIINAPEEDAG